MPKPTAKIPIAKPYTDASEEEAVLRVLRSGWISQGAVGEAFEKAVAEFVGVPFARAVNSGTSAIHLALLACGVRAGDDVVVPAFTCVATLHPVERIGARPVPADIGLETYAMDPDRAAAAVTPRTRAVIVVHPFGCCAPMDRFEDVLATHPVAVVEDAALGLGGRIRGRNAGSWGRASTLSFHPRKMITTGEGGMVLTADAGIDGSVSRLRNYGASVAAWKRHGNRLFDLPEYDGAGFNFKLSDLLAAVGLEQVKKLPDMLNRRRAIARRYHEALSGVPWLKPPSVPDGYDHAYQSYVCRLDGTDPDALERVRSRLFLHLDGNAIAAVQAAQSRATVAYYRRTYGWAPGDFPNALLADRAGFALPIHPGLATADQDRVIDAVRSFHP